MKEEVRKVHLKKRGTLRALAKEIGVSTWTVRKFKQLGDIVAHTNSIKPFLTGRNCAFIQFSLPILHFSPFQQEGNNLLNLVASKIFLLLSFPHGLQVMEWPLSKSGDEFSYGVFLPAQTEQ